MEIKKCARCGNFFSSEFAVCKNCERKDNAELKKLKVFIAEQLEEGNTKYDVVSSTGIAMKNLNRYLSGKEFKGVNIPDTKEKNIEV